MTTLLPVEGRRLSLDVRTVPDPVFEDQLVRLTNGAPIVVRGAARSENGDTVTVRGATSFLGMTDLPVEVVARAGAERPQVTVRFTLIEGRPGPNAWFFGRSFPGLPAFGGRGEKAFGTGVGPQARKNILNGLVLADASFLLTTFGGSDPVTGARLEPGLNFAARCTPTGLVGLLGSALGGGEVVLAGQVVVPRPEERTVPIAKLPLLKYPWQLPRREPGIHLFADLGLDRGLGSALRLHDVGLRIYCPVSEEWAKGNPTFPPVLGAAAILDAPSTGQSLDITAVGIDGSSQLTFFGLFEGVELGDLTELADLAGPGDLSGSLPKDVRDGLGTLRRIGLEAITVSLGARWNVHSVGLAIGLRELDTRVVPGVIVRSLLANFIVSDPFGPGRSLGVEFGGNLEFLGAPFDVSVSLPDVAATARMSEGRSVPFAELCREVGLPAPPAPLVISQFQLGIESDGSIGVAATMAPEPGWTINLGPVPLTFTEVNVVAQRKAGGGASGKISGRLAIGGFLELSGSYDTPGDFLLRGELPDTSLREIFGALSDRQVLVPEKFDLDFFDSVALIRKSGNDLVFQLATTMEELGTVALEVRRVSTGSGSWGAAVGVQLSEPRLSALPGLEGLKMFDDVFRLDELVLVVSSFEDPGFRFPALSVFNSPQIRAGELALPSSGGVIEGLNVHARWTIDTSSREHRLLQKFLGLDPALAVTLQVGVPPTKDSRLYVSYDTKVLGHPLHCEFGGQIRERSVGIFLKGDLETSIQDQRQRFEVTLLFVANGAFLAGSMEGSITFEGFTLSNLALVAGINWEGIPSLGIAATLTFSEFHSSLAVFFDSTDPTRSMLAGAVSDLSLVEVVEKLAGADVPRELEQVLPKVALVGTSDFFLEAEISEALNNLEIEKVSAAFARQNVSLPGDSMSVVLSVGQPGQRWFLTDMTQLLHYQLERKEGKIRVTLEPQFYCVPQTTFLGALRFDQGVFLNSGLEIYSFDAMARILVKPSQGISLDGHLDRIVIGHEKLFSLTSDMDPQRGPSLSAATTHQQSDDPDRANPHFLVDGQVTLLGIKRGARAKLGSDGFALHLDGTLVPGFDYVFDAHFSGLANLGISGSVDIGVGTIDLGPLGKVEIGTGVKGKLDAGVDATRIWAGVQAGFSFAGRRFDLPELRLDAANPSLEKLPGELYSAVTKELEDWFRDATHWLGALRQGLVKGAGETGMVLKEAVGLGADAAAKAMKEAGFVASEVGAALSQGYGVIAGQATQILKGAGYAVDEVGKALQSVFGTPAQEAAKLMRGAGYTAEQVGTALSQVYDLAAAEVTQFLRGAGYVVHEVGAVLKGIFGASPKDAARFLRNAGFPADEVGLVLRSVWSVPADVAALALRGAGYAVGEVGAFLRAAFGLGPQALKGVLEGAGFAANEVKGFFQSLGGEFAKLFSSVIEKLDPRRW